MERISSLSTSSVIAIQKTLKSLGLYTDKIDGIPGKNTRKAICDWRNLFFAAERGKVIFSAEIDMLSFDIKDIDQSMHSVEDVYGGFEYVDKPGGLVSISSTWISQNLLSMDFPWFGRLTVHKKVIPSLMSIGKILEEKLPDYEIHTIGAFNPRHMLYNASKPLSLHTWGIAVDINWQENAYGSIGKMPKEVVDVFENFGWTWGGRWGGLKWNDQTVMWESSSRNKMKHCDPMHFQAY